MAAPRMTRGSFRGLSGSTEKDGRTRVVLIMPRSYRPEYEQVVESVQNNEVIFSTYLRPRSELEEIEENGFNASGHSIHLIDIATKDLGIWMKPLVSIGWARLEVTISPTSNADFLESSWSCFRHPEASDSPSILLPFDPLDFQGKCYTFSSNVEDEGDMPVENDPQVVIDSNEDEEILDSPKDEDEFSVVEVVAEENTESPLMVEVRQTIEMLRADGLDMTGIMEHAKFLDVSERASAAGIDVWTMVVGIFQ